MMTARRQGHDLLSRLPSVRGRYVENVDLAAVTWFRVGGVVDIVYYPADVEDLAMFLATCPIEIPRQVLGSGSNILVRDGGVRGVVVRLDKRFNQIQIQDDRVVTGGGALDVNLARLCKDQAIVGFEFLRGIPGTVGGGLRMNGGAYGRAFKDVLVWAEALDGQGRKHRISVDDLGLSYRHCGAPEDWIFTAAEFKGEQGRLDKISSRMRQVTQERKDSQPVNTRTGGSTFKNPSEEDPNGLKAWELIDRAGCRGLARGGAQVSLLHCNFLINTGNAVAADLEGLGEEVRRRVHANSGVMLQWEICIIGEHGVESELAEAVP